MKCIKCEGKGYVKDKRKRTGISTCLKCNGVGKISTDPNVTYHRTSLHTWTEYRYGDEIVRSCD